MIFGFNPNKAKTQCKLGVGRIKLLRNKRLIALKTFRREVAELLRQGKQGNARIRVEAVIREQSLLQAYEILELYLELISMRCELMHKQKQMPPDMMEAICSVVYAGQRVATDLVEVGTLRKMLIDKYQSTYSNKDQDFTAEASSDLTFRKWLVNENLAACLSVDAPRPEIKIQFMKEIAEEYGVPFDAEQAALEMLPAGGKPLSVPAFPPAETIMAAGPPGAHAEPAAGPLPAWQPPATAGPTSPAAASAAAAAHAADMGFAGTSTIVRPALGGAAPAAAAAPASGPGGALPPGWSPPTPKDGGGGAGKAFQTHLASAGNWAQNKRASGEGGRGNSSGLNGSGGQAGERSSASSPADESASECSSPGKAGGIITPASSYQDANAAAEAAKRYSEMARKAAEAAEQYARSGGPRLGGSGHSSAPGSGGPGSPMLASNAAARHGDDAEYQRIQRQYDAAPGPPSKAEALSAGPASAPPAPPAHSAAPAPAPAAAAAPTPPAAFDLPSPPAATPGPSGETDPLDELTARFEALKRR